ncbi:Dcp2, box A domain-containing protein [Lipomyces arxii]|uniref:Dcp2, box A domain-containing protein n=1 Tax=Lipomyces arxii TaxID=56418 RepID=UPI0034CEA6ED
MPFHSAFNFAYATLSEVLDDLSVRFIVNCPPEELESVERICFQVEEAHWFYEDFVRAENPQLPSLSQKNFTARIFAHCPLLRKWSDIQDQAFADFIEYKTRVPVRGTIILNDTMDQCILVKGWKSSAGWGFPKGKINQGENDSACAVREVVEETGYDVSALLKEEDYIELTMREQQVRLYIIVGVPMDAVFQPQTRKEISKIEWFPLSSLPTFAAIRADAPTANGMNHKKFYLVAPFIKPLRKWINAHRPQTAPQMTMKHQSSPVTSESRQGKSKGKKKKQLVQDTQSLKSELALEPELEPAPMPVPARMPMTVPTSAPMAMPIPLPAPVPMMVPAPNRAPVLDPAKQILAMIKK